MPEILLDWRTLLGFFADAAHSFLGYSPTPSEQEIKRNRGLFCRVTLVGSRRSGRIVHAMRHGANRWGSWAVLRRVATELRLHPRIQRAE
jgi:hypothetical protein